MAMDPRFQGNDKLQIQNNKKRPPQGRFFFPQMNISAGPHSFQIETQLL